MPQCPKCNHSNTDKSEKNYWKFCELCGERLIGFSFVGNGNDVLWIPDDSRICDSGGF